MAHITLTGVLLDPTGEFSVGDRVRFTHRTSTGDTVKTAQSMLTIPPDGSYNIDLEYGEVLVEYSDYRKPDFKNVGVVIVNQDSTATSIPELLNAVVPPTDAQLLEFQSILGDTTEQAQIATDAALRAEGASSGGQSANIVFLTYALLDAYTPAGEAEERGSYKVTNDTDTSKNGYYHWVSGTTYEKDSDLMGDRSITRAKLSADFMFNGGIPANSDIEDMKIDGIYYGAPNNGYIGLPSDFGDGNFNLYVNEGFNGTGAFVFQRLCNFNNASEKWVRRIGSPWIREFQNERMLTKGELADGLSLRDASEDGNYLLPSANNYLDMPTEITDSDFVLKVNDGFLAPSGVFVQQRLELSSNPNEAWVRRVNVSGADGQPWSRSTSGSGATGRDQLAAYFDGGADIVSGSVDDVANSGVYLVPNANTVAGLPVGAASGILEVRRNDDGGWGYQEYTDLFTATLKQRRMTRAGFTPEPWQGMAASGKIIACFGDSITENGTYPQQLAQMIGGEVLRMGFGGCRMANHEDSGYNAMSMCNISANIKTGDYVSLINGAQDVFDRTGDDNRVQAQLIANTDWATVDYAIIFFGTNDYSAGVPIGTDTDTDGTTFAGGINKTVTNLLGANPSLKILFITPFWRPRILAGDGKESDSYPNSNGDYLINFADKIINSADSHHVASQDLYRKSGIGLLTQNEYLGAGDDIHPSDPAGYSYLAQKIASGFKANF